jgi:hypothetical protein
MGRSPNIRIARTVAMAVIIGIGIFNLYQAVIGWTMADASAYWNAALRLREGADLYPPVPILEASDVYRYAPWFAWLAVPFTFLPIQIAGAVWSVILLAASAVAMQPLVKARAWLPLALFGPILIGISANGNVHALLIATLMHGVERRSGPLWIAMAASLKVFPLLLALVYAGRRQWIRFALAVLITGALWAPALLFDLSNYPNQAGRAVALSAIPVLYFVVAGTAMGATLALASSRFAWLAAATTVTLALPRLFVYDVTYLMLGVLPVARVGAGHPPAPQLNGGQARG